MRKLLELDNILIFKLGNGYTYVLSLQKFINVESLESVCFSVCMLHFIFFIYKKNIKLFVSACIYIFYISIKK